VPKSKPPFRLIRPRVSADTVEALTTLLAAAKRGEVIGIAYAAMLSGRKVIINTTGEARRSPIFARGMVTYLAQSIRPDGRPE